MPELAIETRALKKSYGDVEAVRGIDVTVTHGEVFALLGPNGAGKTTTVEILEGYRKPSSGEVRVLGHAPEKQERAFKDRIGIVLQETGIERFLTVAEAVDMFRGYYPHPRDRDEVIELVGLDEKRNTLVRKLSGGQQRRLDVAIGLAGDPDLLFLDEPTTGFDPAARRGAWEMVHNLKSLGKTVFLTTHYMDEAQNLADRVAIIVGGLIVAEGSPAELVGSRGDVTRVTFRLPDGAPHPPASLTGGAEPGGRISIETAEPTKLLHGLTSWAITEGVGLLDLTVSKPSLEDVYLELTKSGDA
jgi:ABC-2 type transport system ATP-binding protein